VNSLKARKSYLTRALTPAQTKKKTNTKMSQDAVPLILEIKEDVKYDAKNYKIPYGPPNDRRKTEIRLNCYKDGCKEEFLQFIIDFKHHATRLGWSTPALLFENIESLLLGAAINQWQVVSFGLDADDPDSFEKHRTKLTT
jgi:hypothetical protein